MAHRGAILTAYILAGASASTAFSWGIAFLSPSADAAPVPAELTAETVVADHNDDGNGTRNRNIMSVRSPASNSGYQHMSNSNADGHTSVHDALCAHVSICTISQKETVVVPNKVKSVVLRKAINLYPAKVDKPK
jgi:hypothetical protein